MKRKLELLFRYLSYRINATDTHGIHSPFVYNLLQDVIYNYTPYYIYGDLELLREKSLLDNGKVNVHDLGVGSKVNKNKIRTIAVICSTSVKKPKYAQLLFRLAQHIQPTCMIELGTSLGITTLYLSHAAPEATIYSVEGSPEIATIALSNFEKYHGNNIQLEIGSFDIHLPKILEKESKIDLVFFDGNHDKTATLGYFNLCLNKVHEDSLFIFDDIHWSTGMEEAWKTICQHSEVSITIDLFEMGLVFFKKRKQKEHFVIRF